METLRVSLGTRSYDIAISEGTVTKGAEGGPGGAVAALGLSGRVALISNPTVFDLYGAGVRESLKAAGLEPVTVIVPDGEAYKTLEWTGNILGEMLKHRLDRGSAVIALGGGVIGDMAGFAASLYMRGIRLVQVPTTLLSQVDSSVGGKTGVNHRLGKNMIGAFWQPSLVWIDVGTLGSLPEREFVSGMAEVIKYGVIRDRGLFDYVLDERRGISSLDPSSLMHIIRRSCEIKAGVVSADEREAGLRAILNFGHTIGHAVETVTGYGTYLHGEAVAIGMCREAALSSGMGVMKKEDEERLFTAVESYGLPSDIPKGIGAGALIESMTLDKKTLGGVIRFILPEEIGRVRVNEPVPAEAIERFLAGG